MVKELRDEVEDWIANDWLKYGDRSPPLDPADTNADSLLLLELWPPINIHRNRLPAVILPDPVLARLPPPLLPPLPPGLP